jgi:hypothetical protein
MKIYNYEYTSNQSNATIVISVRTEFGRNVANAIAEDELARAFSADATSWTVEDMSEEAY